MRGMATYRKFKKFVVLGVAASREAHVDLDPFSLPRQSRDKDSNIVLINIPAELFSAQHFVEFSENGEGEQQTPFMKRQLK